MILGNLSQCYSAVLKSIAVKTYGIRRFMAQGVAEVVWSVEHDDL